MTTALASEPVVSLSLKTHRAERLEAGDFIPDHHLQTLPDIPAQFTDIAGTVLHHVLPELRPKGILQLCEFGGFLRGHGFSEKRKRVSAIFSGRTKTLYNFLVRGRTFILKQSVRCQSGSPRGLLQFLPQRVFNLAPPLRIHKLAGSWLQKVLRRDRVV